MEIIDTIKNIDPEKLRMYLVLLILLAVFIIYPGMWIGVINMFLGAFGIGGIENIPSGFWFMLFAVLFFGFALFLMMILQKKKQKTVSRPKDNIPKGFCDICNNENARNVLPMDYNEGGNISKIYVCEKCRMDVKEIRDDKRTQS